MRERKNTHSIFCGWKKLKVKNNVENLGVEGTIILKLIC